MPRYAQKPPESGSTSVAYPTLTSSDSSLTETFDDDYAWESRVNDQANAKYFIRRITMYPGPWILQADGRSFYVSLGVKL
ncbi:MAG: hypothetical protein Q8939_18795 [Bacteroidota bacterium]|nr:hypothetical protein [Bacteroidota bacterium]